MMLELTHHYICNNLLLRREVEITKGPDNTLDAGWKLKKGDEPGVEEG